MEKKKTTTKDKKTKKQNPKNKTPKTKTAKKSKTSKTSKTTKTKSSKSRISKKQSGGTNIGTAAVGTIKSMIDLGMNIGKEIDAIMHMGRDFNKATDVKLPNETTPDQKVTSTTGTFTQPKYPAAKV